MGDTAQSDILVYARVDIAAAMIITLPDPRTTRMVIENIRLAPRAAIIARGRCNISLWELEKAGADHVVDEENAVGIYLARKMCDDSFQPTSFGFGLWISREASPTGNHLIGNLEPLSFIYGCRQRQRIGMFGRTTDAIGFEVILAVQHQRFTAQRPTAA